MRQNKAALFTREDAMQIIYEDTKLGRSAIEIAQHLLDERLIGYTPNSAIVHRIWDKYGGRKQFLALMTKRIAAAQPLTDADGRVGRKRVDLQLTDEQLQQLANDIRQFGDSRACNALPGISKPALKNFLNLRFGDVANFLNAYPNRKKASR